MSDVKFSIILPCYNVENYIAECLESLINQSYKNLEIICVNDGSSDGTLKVIEDYIAKDNRIQVVTQTNQGQGVARNNGVKLAAGDFISFIDPDDWIELDTYEQLNRFIETHDSTVVEFNYKLYYDATKQFATSKHIDSFLKRYKFDIIKHQSYNWKNLKKLLLHYKSSSCTKVYKKSFLIDNEIMFSPHKNGEDIPFALAVVLSAERIDFINKEFYIYRRRPESSSNTLQKQDMLYLFDQIDMTREIVSKYGLLEPLSKDFSNYKKRLIYDANKKCAPEYRKTVNQKAAQYLSRGEYISF